MEERIIGQHPVIEGLFTSYEKILGPDLGKYKHHVYRIFNYAIFLSHYQEQEKYAVAAFFHDLGIWTHHTFDYLEPSIQLAKDYILQRAEKLNAEEIAVMIDQHHKLTTYKGSFEISVENFRKADWVDVSMGLMHFDIPRGLIRKAEKQFPYLGFHFMLVKLFGSYFLRHPAHPLPMFKK